MWFEATETLSGLATQPAALGTALLGALFALLRQERRQRGERRRSRRRQAEAMAYMLLDDWRVTDARGMGRRICRVVSRHSAFGSAALLVRDATGRLQITASQRTDDLTVRALERWAEAECAREQKRRSDEVAGREAEGQLGAQLVRLERRSGYQPGDPAALAWCTAILVPMRNRRGHVTGAIAVCADRFRGRRRADLETALGPLQALAARFAEGVAALSPDRAAAAAVAAEVDMASSRREQLEMAGA